MNGSNGRFRSIQNNTNTTPSGLASRPRWYTPMERWPAADRLPASIERQRPLNTAGTTAAGRCTPPPGPGRRAAGRRRSGWRRSRDSANPSADETGSAGKTNILSAESDAARQRRGAESWRWPPLAADSAYRPARGGHWWTLDEMTHPHHSLTAARRASAAFFFSGRIMSHTSKPSRPPKKPTNPHKMPFSPRAFASRYMKYERARDRHSEINGSHPNAYTTEHGAHRDRASGGVGIAIRPKGQEGWRAK